MKKIEIGIATLSPTNAPQYVVVMKENNGNRRIPIVIGPLEAQAIAIELKKITPPRPMTHDLFINTLSAFGIVLIEVIITKVKDGIFFSELVCEQSATETKIRIDSRTSDAIALAIRFKCKIFIYEDIMNKTAFDLSNFIKEKDTLSKEKNTQHKINILKIQLQEAIKKEEYELAAKIKEQITQLEKNLKS